MNANHNSVTDGGIAVTDNLNADKLFTYNNLVDIGLLLIQILILDLKVVSYHLDL